MIELSKQAIVTLDQEAARCREFTLKNKREAMSIWDASSGKVLGKFEGNGISVEMGDKSLAERPNTVCLHSHPGLSTFSTQDVMMTTANEFLGFVVTEDGSLYRTNGFINEKGTGRAGFMTSLARLETMTAYVGFLLDKYAKEGTDWETDPYSWTDQQLVVTHNIMLAGKKMGWVNYEASLGPRTKELEEKYQGEFPLEQMVKHLDIAYPTVMQALALKRLFGEIGGKESD